MPIDQSTKTKAKDPEITDLELQPILTDVYGVMSTCEKAARLY